MWLCHNRAPSWTRLRHEVRDLDGQPPVHAHLFHHLVEEVFSFGIATGLERLLEVAHGVGDVGDIEGGESTSRREGVGPT
jgi:hypothetical protein